ncbi:hypothetical protein Ancab_018767 [Ancistrocladus abbreviatus]
MVTCGDRFLKLLQRVGINNLKALLSSALAGCKALQIAIFPESTPSIKLFNSNSMGSRRAPGLWRTAARHLAAWALSFSRDLVCKSSRS